MTIKGIHIQLVASLLLSGLLITGCGNAEDPSRDAEKQVHTEQAGEVQSKTAQPNEHIMTGTLLHLDLEEHKLSIDVSDWVNRGKTEVIDIMHSQTIVYDEQTSFESEHGPIQPEEFKKGQLLAIYPSEMSADITADNREIPIQADQIVMLTMTKEQKLERMLASPGSFHTVVLYDEGTLPPYDELDFEEHVPESFSGGISWIPYTPGNAVDYKEELNIEQLPVILVFDDQGVVFQTESMEQLKIWSETHR